MLNLSEHAIYDNKSIYHNEVHVWHIFGKIESYNLYRQYTMAVVFSFVKEFPLFIESISNSN